MGLQSERFFDLTTAIAAHNDTMSARADAKITALATGSRGDVQPFMELGNEMIKRGHCFKVENIKNH